MNAEPPFDVVDRLLERWAVSVNGGAPAPWAETIASKPPALPDDLAIEVDQAVCGAPIYIPVMVKSWYRRGLPAEAIASQCGFSDRTSVYPKLPSQ